MLRRLDGSFYNNIKSNKNRTDGHCDFSYKGQIVLRITDCDSFLVLESPFLLTNDSYGHSLILLDYDEDLIASIIKRLDDAVKVFKILIVVLQDRFEYFKRNSCFYFKVGNVVLKLCLEYGNWRCISIVSPSSSFSYLNVINNLCRDFCSITGNEVGLELDFDSEICNSSSFS